MKKPWRSGVVTLLLLFGVLGGSARAQTESPLYFPHYANGDVWAVQLVLSNLDPYRSAPVVVKAYDQQGRSVPGLFDSATSFEIPARGSRLLRSAGGTELRSGWIEVHSQAGSVSGLLTYRNVETGIEVGVAPVELSDHFALLIEESEDIGTGLAIFKPHADTEIELQFRDEAGNDPLGKVLTFEDFQQQALVLPDWLEGIDQTFLDDFRGILLLRSADGSSFAPLGLRFGKRQGSLSALPALPLEGEGGEPAHNVMVKVARVTPDWHGFVLPNGGGWPALVTVRESDALKYFEATIWDETRSIHFYEFDNDFDPFGFDITPEQLTANRESYVILKVDGMPDPWTDARSRFIKQAFADFTTLLAKRYPDSDHHLMYVGHGAPGGQLFEGQLTYEDAGDLLAEWTRALGRPLGVIDMGGPCNKASFSDLENFCRHSRYYVASDMPNGGYTFDDWTIEKHEETDPVIQYHRLFAETSTLREALVGRIDIRRRDYEYSRINMKESRTQQANYLYSCRKFADFVPAFRTFLSGQDSEYGVFDDLFDYMVAHRAGDDLLGLFDNIFLHRADNRDFFEWDQSANGMLMPSPAR
ncbi:MAG: hypothetical protein OXH92_19110 [Bryobacterales bacterium]|nr:hypothetical protein [Bryobacterales bacterium]